jgi:transcriptional regulator with XRE-family HTH domain
MMEKRIEIAALGRVVADNVALLRRARGMQYKQLAHALANEGRTIPALGLRRIEAYQRRIDVDDLAALAVVFDVPVESLLHPMRVVADGYSFG